MKTNCEIEIMAFFQNDEEAIRWAFDELVDAAWNYGQVNAQGTKYLGMHFHGGEPIWIIVSENRSTTMVSHTRGQIEVTKDAVIIADEGRRAAIFWSRCISPTEVQQTLKAIDEQMAKVGQYDKATGKRRYVPSGTLTTAEKISIAAVFRPYWKQVAVEGDEDTTDEYALNCFDKPEELAIVGRSKGLIRIATKRGLKLRDEIGDIVMAERNLPPSSFDSLPTETKLEIIREIDRRLEGRSES